MSLILVTGGGGFVGSALCRRLVERGHTIRSLKRSGSTALDVLVVDGRRGDVADRETVYSAAKDCEVVFHVAAKAGVWGPADEYHRANVAGTENVLAACREFGVRKLIYTSSPSVVYHGVDENGIDESTPYPDTYLTDYPRTKAI